MAKLNASGTVTSVYILNAANQQITELNGSGAWQHTNIYAPGGRVTSSKSYSELDGFWGAGQFGAVRIHKFRFKSST